MGKSCVPPPPDPRGAFHDPSLPPPDPRREPARRAGWSEIDHTIMAGAIGLGMIVAAGLTMWWTGFGLPADWSTGGAW